MLDEGRSLVNSLTKAVVRKIFCGRLGGGGSGGNGINGTNLDDFEL